MNGFNSNVRNSHNIKKMNRFNNVDKMYSDNELKDLIIKPIRIEKPNIDIKSIASTRETENVKEVGELVKKRTNQPYKGIIKEFDYSKIREKHEEDLIVHKVTEADKDKTVFDNNMNLHKGKIEKHNEEIKDVYSTSKENEHKKEFAFQHKYKYAMKVEGTDADDDLRTDRIEFWKKEQNKIEENKKKIDDILLNLIDSGIISENMDSIDYTKIDTIQLEAQLKSVFGEEEFRKILKELE